MGFYGKITTNSNPQWTFDKVYSNRAQMDYNCLTDGVFVSRRVVVQYDETLNDEWSEAGNLIGIATLEDDTIVGSFTGITSTSIKDNARRIFRISKDRSSGIYGTYSYWYVHYNEEQSISQIELMAVSADDEYANTQIDYRLYASARGYHRTAWEKRIVNDVAEYIMLAELNTVIPTFEITADAPTQEPLPPHFDGTRTSEYYNLHAQPSWGMRISGRDDDNESDDKITIRTKLYVPAETTLQGSDDTLPNYYKNYYIKDTSTGSASYSHPTADYDPTITYYQLAGDNTTERWDTEYTIDTNDIVSKVTLTKTDIPSATYYNKAGFDKTQRHKVENVSDSIDVTPTGVSGNQYNLHNNTGQTLALPDIQELNIQVPSIGNAVCELWDVIYGENRNLSIDWGNDGEHHEIGNRLVTTTTDGFGYEPEQMQNLAASLNTLHDAMGMIIIDASKDESGKEIAYDVNNTDGNVSIINNSSSEKIYYAANKNEPIGTEGYHHGYYRKKVQYDITSYGKGINPYDPDKQDLLYNAVSLDGNLYWYKKYGNTYDFIHEIDGGTDKTREYYNVTATAIDNVIEYEADKYYYLYDSAIDPNGDNGYHLSKAIDDNSKKFALRTINVQASNPIVPKKSGTGESAVYLFWKIPGTSQDWDATKAEPITDWIVDVGSYTYFRYDAKAVTETVYDAETKTWKTETKYVIEPGSLPLKINYPIQYNAAFTGDSDAYLPTPDTSGMTQEQINAIDLVNIAYFAVSSPIVLEVYRPNFDQANGKYYYAVTADDGKVSYYFGTEDYDKTKKYCQISWEKISTIPYEGGVYYYKNDEGIYTLDTNTTMTTGRQYYEKHPVVVYEDTAGEYAVGYEWTVPSATLPDSVTLGYRTEKIIWKELTGFNRTLNTVFGLILKANQMLEMDDDDNRISRNDATLQGCINKCKDLLARFSYITPGDVVVIDGYGRLHGSAQTSAEEYKYKNIGTASDWSAGDTKEDQFINWDVDISISNPNITLGHQSHTETDTTTTSDLNNTTSGDGLNKGQTDAIKLYTPIEDNKGHLVGMNTETVTLPYGFKTITTNGRSDRTKASGNTEEVAEQTNIVADNTQDTIGINSGDIWTKVLTDSTNDIITIYHDVKTTSTSADSASLSSEKDEAITFKVYNDTYDATNHFANKNTTTLTMPNSYGKFSSDSGSSEATATHDTFTVIGDRTQKEDKTFNADGWIQTTASKDQIKIEHIGPVAVAERTVSDLTPKFGDKFTIEDWRFDTTGHKAGVQTHTVTIPKGSYTNTPASAGASGVITNLGFTDTTGAITSTSNYLGAIILGSYTAPNSIQTNAGANIIASNITNNASLASSLNLLDARIMNEEKARADKIYGLKLEDKASDGQYVSAVSQADGQISVSRIDFAPSITITAGTADAAPLVNVTVNTKSGTAQSITTATTGLYGVTKLSSATDSDSEALAATPKAVKAAYDLADGKQDPETTLEGYGITDAVQSNKAITGATHTKITYDEKGLVTSGTDLEASDIPDLSTIYEAVDETILRSNDTFDYTEKGATEASKKTIQEIITDLTARIAALESV